VALSAIEQLREPKAVGGWLRGILRNVCLMHLRENRAEITFGAGPPKDESGASVARREEP
jgi:DNA-directed RNA polymerase specialized sigma24 family protein